MVPDAADPSTVNARMPRAVGALVVALLAGCSDSAPPAQQRTFDPGDLGLATVETALVPRETAFDGVIEAVNRSTVAAQTSGRVVELPFDVGDYVEKGSLIVRLTDTEQAARVEAAEGALAEAEARLAEAQLAYQRTKEVYDKKLIAKAQFDRAAADYNSARARFDAAEAALAEAREGFAYTVIRAPYSGTVVARHVQMGEAVAPGKPLMTGLSLEHLRAVVEIPQQHIGPLRRHAAARMILPGERSVDAAELRIPPNADAATHTFRVLVTLPQGEHGVFPGTLVKVAFVSGEERRMLVPASAVVHRGEVTGAYVVDASGRISLRYLRAGRPAADGRVAVLSGLVAGERVAIDPIAAGIAYKQQAESLARSAQ